VRVNVNDRFAASAVAGESGRWRTHIGFSQPGAYTVTANLLDESSAVVAVSEPLVLTVLEPTATAAPPTPTPEPPTPTHTPVPPTATHTPEPTATATNTPEPTATPVPVAPVIDSSSLPAEILPGDNITVRGDATPGSAVRVTINDRVVASAVTGSGGKWRAHVGFSQPGTYTVTAQLIDDQAAVIAVSEPAVVTVLEPTPTEAPTPVAAATITETATVTPSATITTGATVTATEPITAAAAMTGTVTVTPTTPGALPGTGVSLDRLGGYNMLLPLALVLGLLLTTLWQKRGSDQTR
jgi:hypothetical protein